MVEVEEVPADTPVTKPKMEEPSASNQQQQKHQSQQSQPQRQNNPLASPFGFSPMVIGLVVYLAVVLGKSMYGE